MTIERLVEIDFCRNIIESVMYDTNILYITSFKGNETKFAHKPYMLPGNFLSVSLSAR